jgi:MFS family permease
MFPALLSVRSLLLAIFMLMAGSGSVATLISLRLERAGVDTMMIGAVATAYFAGLVIGALRAGAVMTRVGHIRAFAAFVALLSASTLAYSLVDSAPIWAVLRLTDGVCVAGVFVCLESWLNDRAAPDVRGGLLAGYMVALYSGQAVGQLLLSIYGGMPAAPFQLASILISLAIIPLCLTRSTAPAVPERHDVSVASLFSASPLGVAGAVATGLMLGAFYGLAAVHVRRIGLEIGEIATFMMVVILGGVALQWPLGRLSDGYDRRSVLVWSFGATTAVGVALALLQHSGLRLFAFGALFGGLSFALYPLCVAHCNDRLPAAERVGASGLLVLLYSAGAAVGPVAGAAAMTLVGRGGLFFFVAMCAGAAFAFGIWRQSARPPVPGMDQGEFRLVARTTPTAAAMLDPPEGEEANATPVPARFGV